MSGEVPKLKGAEYPERITVCVPAGSKKRIKDAKTNGIDAPEHLRTRVIKALEELPS